MTEEEFLKKLNLKSMATFERWESSQEFKHVSAIVLASKQADDLISIYDKVKKSIKGPAPDKKDLDFMLKLMKEINLHNKEALRYFSKDIEQEEDDLDIG